MKELYESKELQIFRGLKARSTLTKNEENYYWKLEKGFEGEQKFNVFLDNLTIDAILLNDLLFEKGSNHFQLDKVLITQDTVYVFEVKNYEGDYYIDRDTWFSPAKKEVTDPLNQLKRSKNLFQPILRELGCKPSLESYLIFINPQFYLYHAPLNPIFVFPTQINRLIKQLNTKTSKLNSHHYNLAERLIALHIQESTYSRVPEYRFDKLKKGIICRNCFTFMNFMNRKTLDCYRCGFTEGVISAVIRSVEEFKIMFPGRKITTRAIHEWCNVVKSPRTIRRILLGKYKLIGSRNKAYFIED